MLRVLNKQRGKLFIQVWALEQEPPLPESGLLLSEAAQATLLYDEQQQPAGTGSSKVKKPRKMDKLLPAVMQRQRPMDSDADVEAKADAGGAGRSGEQQDVFVPWKLQGKDGRAVAGVQEEEETYQRYYHLFKAGELRELIQEAGVEMGLSHIIEVEPERWEQGNWWIRAVMLDK